MSSLNSEEEFKNSEENFKVTRNELKVAVIHDWIFCRRGGERVLERILNLYPQADLYYLFGNPKKVLQLNHQHRFFPSFLSKIPFISKIYKLLLPLLPLAIESFDLKDYDLVISSSHCVAKGVIPHPAAKHVSYIHSPMRYAWDKEHDYFSKISSLFQFHKILRAFLLHRLRIWDVTSSARIDLLIANSSFVARRCSLYYGRTTQVVYPPIEVGRFISSHSPLLADNKRKVLLFGAWVSYKGMYEALEQLVLHKIPVIAAGQGESLKKAMKHFSQSDVEFCLEPTDLEVVALYQRSHVLLFPGLEDFGIVPLEATASGKWVVAPDKGGTAETVIDNVTGFLFQEGNSVDMLNKVKKAIGKEISSVSMAQMHKQAQAFGPLIFDESFKQCIQKIL